MTDTAPVEARLQRSLTVMRREVMDAIERPSAEDGFGNSLRIAMTRLKKLLGFS